MSTNTENLELYEKNSSDWATDNFNIQTMLNDNFDKIDAWAGDVEEELDEIKNGHALHAIGVPRVGFGSVAWTGSGNAHSISIGFAPEAVFLYCNEYQKSQHVIVNRGQTSAYIADGNTISSVSLEWGSNSLTFTGGFAVPNGKSIRWMAIGIQPEA